MKKLYSILIILFCLMILFQSCSKQSSQEMIAPVSPNIINAKISPNQAYVFNVSSLGNVAIEKQASHYKLSNTTADAKTGHIVYQYLPTQDYTGTDEVVLSSKTTIISAGSSGGCSSGHSDNLVSTKYISTSYTTIRLIISK